MPLPLHRAFWARATAVSARLGPAELALGLGLALTAVIGTIGADARWLPALGQAIIEQGKVPRGVPFAAAPLQLDKFLVVWLGNLVRIGAGVPAKG